MASDPVFAVDVRTTLGGREIAVRFASGPGITVVFGPSGAGKTTLLNMVAGLHRPAAGRVAVAREVFFDAGEGIDIAPERRRAGYVFQDARLFPHLRVRGNLAYGRRMGEGLDPKVVLDLLGIGHLLERWPRSLSGGEARRVAIGRALLSSPRFLLLDEPLSFLDAARRAEIMTLIERLRDVLALPILMVTHDAAEAERLATAIVRVGD
ncbi:MAG: molybdenum ABC transporter ATP-binding protein [Proteobacteria bacterium SG_bin6]|nr:MAG: molybdenum ABC transporter ATP-binding protein [Proteobacteria bacterium SG_bin6]